MHLLFREKPLGLERGDAAGARRGDRLPEHLVLHVAGREDALDARLRRAGDCARSARA